MVSEPVTVVTSSSSSEESPDYDDSSSGEESNCYEGSSLRCAECDSRFTGVAKKWQLVVIPHIVKGGFTGNV